MVEDGKVIVGKLMKVHATFDHRLIDGYHASVMSRCLKRFLEDPGAHFDKLDELPMLATLPAAVASVG